MNIYQQQLGNDDIELIKKVLDYTFFIGSTKVCFRNIADKLFLDLSIPENDECESISIDALQSDIERLKKEIDDLINSGENPDGDRVGSLKMRQSEMAKIIKGNGKIIVSLLGSFYSKNQTVYLYLNTIERKARSITNIVATEITKPLITTFIHEMFHAWNYFASNSHERTVEEIDEAMVECYTLLFLQDISRSMPEFEPIFEWAKGKIKGKQSSIGKQSAYGFGYYLFSLWETKDSDRLQKMIEAYCTKSGRLNNQSGLIKSTQNKFSTTYPRNEESPVFELFYMAIVSGGIRGQVWTPSGKTNIITNGSNLLFENNVDEIEVIKNDKYDLYRVKEDIVYRIYCQYRQKWFLLFDETFDQIVSLQYGIETVIFLKIHDDHKTYMLTLLDIKKILYDNISNNTGTKNTLLSNCCISADEFYKFEDEGMPIIIARNGDSYDYIFPLSRRKPKVIPNIEYHPCNIGVSYFQFRNSDYVYVDVNIEDSEDWAPASIYTIGGKHIGDFGYFAPPIDTPYSMCQMNGKWNYYSFEKMGILFGKWFDEIDPAFEVDRGVFFPIAENGICKIIDKNGCDVSCNFQDALSTWRKDYEELKLVHSQKK